MIMYSTNVVLSRGHYDPVFHRHVLQLETFQFTQQKLHCYSDISTVLLHWCFFNTGKHNSAISTLREQPHMCVVRFDFDPFLSTHVLGFAKQYSADFRIQFEMISWSPQPITQDPHCYNHHTMPLNPGSFSTTVPYNGNYMKARVLQQREGNVRWESVATILSDIFNSEYKKSNTSRLNSTSPIPTTGFLVAPCHSIVLGIYLFVTLRIHNNT